MMNTKKFLGKTCLKRKFDTKTVFETFDPELFQEQCPPYFHYGGQANWCYEVIAVEKSNGISLFYYPRYRKFTGYSKETFMNLKSKERYVVVRDLDKSISGNLWNSIIITVVNAAFSLVLAYSLIVLSPLVLIMGKRFEDLSLELKSFFLAKYKIPFLLYIDVYTYFKFYYSENSITWYIPFSDLRNYKQYGGPFENYISNNYNKEYTHGIISAFYNMYSTTQENPLKNENSLKGF